MANTSSWTVDDIPALEGKTFVVTGANSGLGLESALALARAGAMVVLACRNPQRGEAALEQVAEVATGPDPRLLLLDLSDLDSVEAAADELAVEFSRIDVLMNNAGVMALPEHRTVQGHEMQFGTNHLGHFALTGRLLPLLLEAPDPRVVTTSSQMHRIGKMDWSDLDWKSRRYQSWPAYGQSKLANLLFSYELGRRAKHVGTELAAMAAHPGYSDTNLQGTGLLMSGRALSARLTGLANKLVGQPAAAGALPQLFAATSPDARSGSYYGPSGLAEMRGGPKEVTPMDAARSRDEGHRLWNLSEMMTGVKYQWPAS